MPASAYRCYPQAAYPQAAHGGAQAHSPYSPSGMIQAGGHVAMARLEDIPQPTRDAVASAPCPSFDRAPFVSGPPLAERRVAIVSSAALIRRGDRPFPFGSAEVRFLPADAPLEDLLIGHVSINFDRSGYQRDINTVYPIERLRELARA